MKTAGQRFNEIRQALNLPQQEFGLKLGLSSQGISNIEKDKSFLTLEKMQALESFNISLNYLVYGKGSMFIETASEPDSAAIESIMLNLLRKHGIIK